MAEQTGTTPARVVEDDLEDVRIAVVMSGGVSLAIWIGGVAREINLLTEVDREHDGDHPYVALLDVTQSTARVDVISGTSAGGINGAFLALGTVLGADLGPLSELWADKGALGRLLRSPMESDPPSLLRGDGYFLPELVAAVRALHTGSGGSYRPPQDRPVDLMMTTSVLSGQPQVFTDRFGNRIHEVDHLGLFRFRRDELTAPAWKGGAGDPFLGPDIVGQLALAARSTASFPFAFEASYVPIGPEHASRLHPDMAGIASFTRSRFVIDGGVLVNRPVGLALRAIFAQPAERQVRRLLAYVDPDPAGEVTAGHDDPDEPPTLRKVLVDSLLTLPRSQSIARDLAALQQHNHAVDQRRRVRIELDGARIELADALYDAYRRRRVGRAADHVLALGRRIEAFGSDGADERVPAWSGEELRAALEALADGAALPFVPAPGPLAAALPAGPEAPWTWGLAPAERLVAVAVDVYKRALWVAPMARRDLRRDLREHRRVLHEHIVSLRDARGLDTAFWQHELAAMPEPPEESSARNEVLRDWLTGILARWPVPADAGAGTWAPGGGAEQQVAQRFVFEWAVWTIVARLAGSRDDLERAAAAGLESPIPTIREEAEALRRLLDVLFGESGGAPPTPRLMERLLRLEVLHLMLAPDVDVEQGVDLMHVSAHAPNSFGGLETPATKLAGVRLGHFGAFYKESWRVNDWIWGRIDGATRMCQLLLSPDRLRQLGHDQRSALEAVRDAAVGADPGPEATARERADRDWLVSRFDEQACLRDLRFLDDPDLPVPPSLPSCAMAIARRQHLAILRAELPQLVAAVDADERAGANPLSAGARLRGRYEAATTEHGELPAAVVVDLFRESRVGQETVADDAGSDLFAATVSQASLITVSALDSKRSGLGPARLVTRSIRGFMLVLYALVAGAVRSGRFGRQAVAIALAAGGALLAVALLADEVPDVVVTIGAALVLAGVGLSALRSRMWQFAVLVALPLAVTAVLLVGVTTWEDVVPHLGTITLIGLLVVGSLGLGSLRLPRRAPWPVRGSVVRRVWLLAGSLAAVVGFTLWFAATQPDPGIVAFELMATVERAGSIVGEWGRDGLDAARTGIWVDFAYLLIYWIPIAAAASLLMDATQRRDRPALPLGSALSFAAPLAVAAAVLDAIENLLMLTVIQTAETSGSSLEGLPDVVPAAVTVAATTKFLFLGVALVLVVVPAVALGVDAWRRRATAGR